MPNSYRLFLIFNLEIVHFDIHITYSDAATHLFLSSIIESPSKILETTARDVT